MKFDTLQNCICMTFATSVTTVKIPMWGGNTIINQTDEGNEFDNHRT